jgi:hypothetical protein
MTQHSTFTAVIHGESGAGKSQLADTIPGPRLILDAEGGSEFTPSWPKQIWNPDVYGPPGSAQCEPGQEVPAETVRVLVREWSQWARVHAWLESGQHPFVSVVLDSLTEIQKRCRDNIRGTEQMQTQHWGELLIQMETVVRSMRDLTLNPANPLKNVIILALTDDKKGLFRPFLQGALQQALPGFVHLVGFMYTEPDPSGAGLSRRLMIQPYGQYVAKDRTHVLTKAFGPIIPIRDLDTGQGGYDLREVIAVLESRHQAGTATGGTTA